MYIVKMNTVSWVPCSPEPDLFLRTDRLTVIVQAFRVSCRGVQTTVQCLWLRGELDPQAIGPLEALLKRLTDRGDLRIGLDMSRMAHIHSAALESLIQEASRVDALGGRMRILAPTEEVRQLVDLLGLSCVLPMDDRFRDHLKLLAFPQLERGVRKSLPR